MINAIKTTSIMRVLGVLGLIVFQTFTIKAQSCAIINGTVGCEGGVTDYFSSYQINNYVIVSATEGVHYIEESVSNSAVSLKWLVAGTYQVDFNLSCGNTFVNTVVASTSGNPGTLSSSSQKVCIGETPSSVSINNLEGNILWWEKSSDGTNWTIIQQNSATFKGSTLTSGLMETGPGWDYRVTIRQCQTDHVLTHSVDAEIVANNPTSTIIGGNCSVMSGAWSMTLNQSFPTNAVDEVRFYIRDTGGLLHGTDPDPVKYIVTTAFSNAWVWQTSNVADLGFTPDKITAVPYKAGVALCSSSEISVSSNVTSNPLDPESITFRKDGSVITSLSLCESGAATISANLDRSAPATYSWSLSGHGAVGIDSSSLDLKKLGGTLDGKIHGGTYFVTVDWNDGCNSGQLQKEIVISLEAAGGVASADQSICSGDNSGLSAISLSGKIGNVARWQSKLPSQNWSSATDINVTTNSLAINNIDLYATKDYRAVVTNGTSTCTEYSTSSRVSIVPKANASNLSSTEIGGSCGSSTGTWTVTLNQNFGSVADAVKFKIWGGGFLRGTYDATETTDNVYQFSLNLNTLGWDPEKVTATPYLGTTALCESDEVTVTQNIPTNPADPTKVDIKLDGNTITSLNVCELGSATIAAVLDVIPIGTVDYEWKLDGIVLEDQISSSLSLVKDSDGKIIKGTYSVSVDWSDGCDSDTETTSIVVGYSVAGGTTDGNQTICPGDSGALTAIAVNGSAGSVKRWESKLTTQSDWSQATMINVTSTTLGTSYLDANVARDYRAILTDGATPSCDVPSTSSRVNLRTDVAQTPIAPATSDGNICGGFSAFEIRNDDLSLTAGVTVWHRVAMPNGSQIDIQAFEAPGNPGDYRTSFNAGDHTAGSGNYGISTIYKYGDGTYSCESGSVTVAVSSLPTPPVASDIIFQDCSDPTNCVEYPQSGNSTPLYFFAEEYVTLSTDTDVGKGSANTTVAWIDNSGVTFDTDFEAVLPMIEGFGYQVQMNWESPVCNTRTSSLSESYSIQFKSTGNTILPAHRDVWIIGEAHTLTWPKQGGNASALYDIYVRSESGGPWTSVVSGVSGAENNGELSTTVTVPAVAIGNYQFMVMEAGKNFLYKSPMINIVNSIPGANTITTFEEGQLLKHNNSYSMDWPGTTGKEYVVKQNGANIANTDAATFSWLIPAEIEGPGNTLQMLSLDGTENFITAPVEFVRELELYTPNLDTKYGLGEKIDITWGGGSENNTLRPFYVRLVTELDGNTSTTPLANTTAKVFNWTIPTDLNTMGKYKIEVKQFAKTDGFTDANEDKSDLYFTVVDCPNSRIWSTGDRNYVKTYTAREPLLGCISAYDDENKVQEGIQYLDDLGRQEQTVLREATPTGLDLISMVEYDEWGRMSKSYLPFPVQANTGYYLANADVAQGTYYTQEFTAADGPTAFSKSIYEFEASSRVKESTNPGASWAQGSGHTQEMEYSSNVTADNIKALKSDLLGNIIDKGFYGSGTLHGTFSYDENTGEQEGEVITWTNRSGQVVLKSVKVKHALNVKTYAHTYYVYDDRGNLQHVIQPEGVRLILEEAAYDWSAVNDDLFQQNWMFSYAYDHRNRMIGKRVPGADWVSMVYDKRDRLVATQDGNQYKLTEVINGDETVNQYVGSSYIVESGSVKFQPGFSVKAGEKSFYASATKTATEATGEWVVTKYDALNRPVLTGLKEMQKEPADVQSSIDQFYNAGMIPETYDGGADFHGYDNTSFPNTLSESELLTVSYYDTYDFTSETSPTEARTQLTGQMTGGKTRILGSDTWLGTVNYVDVYYRSVKTITDNHLGGQDVITSAYRNFNSPLIASTSRTHNDGNTTNLTIAEDFTYDHQDRLLRHRHGIDEATPTTVLSEHIYDERGQLVTKDLGGSAAPIQSVDYDYNIRGWLSSINGGTSLTGTDKFGMELNYTSNNQYNGNIGQLAWKAMDQGDAAGQSQQYAFTYDPANRLLGATYSNLDNATANDYFSVSGLGYDHNGNIQSLVRNAKRNSGLSQMDSLVYTYDGNRLVTVDDGGDETPFTDPLDDGITQLKDYGFFDGVDQVKEYQYDANGNMVADANKGLSSITYNHLNLPIQVITADATIKYTYDAAGFKLSKEVTNELNVNTTDYVGGIHYTNTALSFLQHAEGRTLKTGGSFNYEYNLTDHLGNVRVTVNEGGMVTQRDDYYPFGLTFNSSATSPENLYKYAGNEEQKELSLIDFRARFFDPSLGRFTSIDPLSSYEPGWTPYRYAFNNPQKYIDPAGLMEEKTVSDFDGNEWTVQCENGECDDAKKKDESDEEKQDGRLRVKSHSPMIQTMQLFLAGVYVTGRAIEKAYDMAVDYFGSSKEITVLIGGVQYVIEGDSKIGKQIEQFGKPMDPSKSTYVISSSEFKDLMDANGFKGAVDVSKAENVLAALKFISGKAGDAQTIAKGETGKWRIKGFKGDTAIYDQPGVQAIRVGDTVIVDGKKFGPNSNANWEKPKK